MYRIPQMGTFLTTERMSAFWNYVGSLLKYISPILMIFVAFAIVALVLDLIIKTFKKGADNEDRRKDDDDYDMKYY